MTRSSDTLCRFGGDEFLYLAEELASAGQAEEVAERLLDVLTEPFSLAGTRVQQHASIGIVVLEGTGKGWTELIQDADAALYEAKRQGKEHHVLYTPTMRQQAAMFGRVLGDSGRRLAPSPLVEPPPVQSGADTPRSS